MAIHTLSHVLVFFGTFARYMYRKFFSLAAACLIIFLAVYILILLFLCVQSFLTLSFDISKMGIIGVEYRSVELASLIQWA